MTVSIGSYAARYQSLFYRGNIPRSSTFSASQSYAAREGASNKFWSLVGLGLIVFFFGKKHWWKFLVNRGLGFYDSCSDCFGRRHQWKVLVSCGLTKHWWKGLVSHGLGVYDYCRDYFGTKHWWKVLVSHGLGVYDYCSDCFSTKHWW